MIQKAALWTLLLTALLWQGCSQPRSWGDWDEITIFVDSLDQPLVEPLLREVFTAHSITPQLEPWFKLRFADGAELNDLANRRLLLFAGSRIDAETPVNSFVRSLFETDVLARVREGEPLLFARRNALARPQQTVVLPAVDPAGLRALLTERDSSLVSLFLHFALRQEKERIFSRYEQIELSDSLWRMLAVDLRIPHDYQVVNALPEEGMLRFRRYYPDRWIAVQVVPGVAPDPCDHDYLLNLRDSLGVHFHDPVYVERDPDFVRISPVTVGEHAGVCLEGLWGTFEIIGGGPYITYLFPEPERNRTVLIDGAVFAPGKDKNPFMLQLWSVLESFGERK